MALVGTANSLASPVTVTVPDCRTTYRYPTPSADTRSTTSSLLLPLVKLSVVWLAVAVCWRRLPAAVV